MDRRIACVSTRLVHFSAICGVMDNAAVSKTRIAPAVQGEVAVFKLVCEIVLAGVVFWNDLMKSGLAFD